MTSSGEDAKSASSALRRAQSLLCGAIVLACCSYLVLAALGRVHYLGELACMFRYDFGILAAAGVPFLVLLRRWWMAAFVALVTGWAVWPEASLGLRAQPGAFEPRSPRLRVTLANVLRPNPRHDAVIDAVLATKPDVIGLLEVSIPWRNAALARLGDEYPFRVEGLNTGDEWTEHTWGMILFSKTGFASSKVTPIEHWQRSLRPVVEARMDAPIPVTFQIAHPERPGRRDRLAARRKALVALGDADIEGERILMGDLNTTSTSPYFTDLVEASGLRDSRIGFGRQCSWYLGDQLPGPIPLRLPSLLRRGVTIDHALVSDGLHVLERRILKLPGSDHMGIALTVSATEAR